MALRNDRKGNIAIIDAIIFLMLLSAVSVTLFAYDGSDGIGDEPMAKKVCEDLFSVKVSSSVILDTTDTQVLPVAMLVAAGMSSGEEEKMSSLLKDMLDDMIPEIHGYEMIIDYNNHVIKMERQAYDSLSSEYECTQAVIGPMDMKVHIWVY